MNGGYFLFRKEELENEIMKTQKQLESLQTALNKLEETEKEVPEELIFEYEDEYCYVDETGNICWTSYTNLSPTDTDRVHNHRAFLNERLAEIFADKTQFIADMLHFKYLYDRDYEPNWGSEDEHKYFVYYNNRTKKFEYLYATVSQYIEPVYFSTKQLAERCADWLNKKHN